MDTLNNILTNYEQNVQQDNNNSAVHKNYNTAMKISLMDDRENQYQKADNYWLMIFISDVMY